MPSIELKQDAGTLRRCYPEDREQLGAFAKILDVLVDELPPEAKARIAPDALAVLDGIRAVKRKFPKEGRRRQA